MASLNHRPEVPVARFIQHNVFPAAAPSILQLTPMAISVQFQGYPNAYQESNPANPASTIAYPAPSHNMPEPSQMAISIPNQRFSNQYSGPNPMRSAYQFTFQAPHNSLCPQLPSAPYERSSNPNPGTRTAQVGYQIADAMGSQIAAPAQLLPRSPTPSYTIPRRPDQEIFTNPFAGPAPGVSADVPIEISSSPMSPGEGQ